VKFRAGELEFSASVVEASQSPSPQTGDLLQSMTIQFRAQKAVMHEQALEEAQQRQGGGLYSLGDGDEPELEWRVRESSSTYVGTEPWGINHHLWRIEQVERLACERLRLAGLELEPYDYAEEASESGAVRLAARALVTEDELEAISRLGSRTSEVVRVGISDAPRQMRLSGYVWGERPEGLVIVLSLEDVVEPRVTLKGFDGDPEELEDILALVNIDTEELRRRRHARRHVSNVDAWSLMKAEAEARSG
jgi:hypothetical protein